MVGLFVDDIDNDIFCRVPLKPSAILLSNLFLDHLQAELDKSPRHINVMMQIYSDASEGLVMTPDEKYEIFPKLVGEYFDLIPDVFFVIKASTISMGRPAFDIDADYSHDAKTDIDPGEIEVNIVLPPTIKEIRDYIPELRKKLYPVLVHEMQHTVQKMFYGQVLSGAIINTLSSHMSDISEIDARTEEIISIISSPNDEPSFYNELCNYVYRYLHRNLPEPYSKDEFSILETQMINEHMSFYKKRILRNY